MRKFIAKTLLLCSIVFLVFAIFCYAIDYSGNSDWAYKRFTVERKHSLIIGTSRSAQGIHPSIINEKLECSGFRLPVYNFSFTVMASPFGEVYYDAIKKILDTDVDDKKGLFIVSVDPWGLSMEKSWDAEGHREESTCLNRVEFLHQKPNMEYLAYYFHLRDLEWFDKTGTLRDDGWYCVDFSMNDSIVERNVKEKIAIYSTYQIEKSAYRLSYLEKTIELLSNYGDVFLCRVPVHFQMLLIEDSHWKDFDTDIQKIADKYSVPYFSFRNNYKEYRTIDGNHLYKEDGDVFTRNLCDSINSYIID